MRVGKHHTYHCAYLAHEFQQNISFYENDEDLKHLRQKSEEEYQISLQGRLPKISATVPVSLTKEKMLQIQHKISKSRCWGN